MDDESDILPEESSSLCDKQRIDYPHDPPVTGTKINMQTPREFSLKLDADVTKHCKKIQTELWVEQNSIMHIPPANESQSVTSPHQTASTTLCHRSKETSLAKEGGFFYSKLNSQQSRRLLQTSAPGTFLLRPSSTGSLAVTMSTSSGVTSVRIAEGPLGFSLDSSDVEKQVWSEGVLTLLQYHQHHSDWYLEANGVRQATLSFSKPRYNSVRSLKHMSRVALNQSLYIQSDVESLLRKAHVPTKKRSICEYSLVVSSNLSFVEQVREDLIQYMSHYPYKI